jgi:alkyldihydroxyacetonephosphate synthase
LEYPFVMPGRKPFGWPGPSDTTSEQLANRIGESIGRVGDSTSVARLPQLPTPRPFVTLLRAADVGEVSTADDVRLRASVGASLRDTVRAGISAGHLEATDAVIFPCSEAQVLAALRFASDHRVAVVPYGGGTCVSGGLEPSEAEMRSAGLDGRIALHLGRMADVIAINLVDLTCTVQPGCLGPALEKALRPHGLTARFFPQSFAESTVGGWVATRAGGHFAVGPTRIDDQVQSLRMATPMGMVVTPRLPASGSGPDPKRMLLGGEGALGVITEVVLRVQRAPASRSTATFDFGGESSLLNAANAARAVVQSGLLPANLRAVDALEAAVMGLGNGSDAVLLLAFESQLAGGAVCDALMAAASALIVRAGGICRPPLGKDQRETSNSTAGSAAQWKRSFVTAPAARDEMLLRGMLVETFETAVCWSGLKALQTGVSAAVLDAGKRLSLPLMITCRLTHVYTDGCAPYFSVISSEKLEPARCLEAWDVIKEAANAALAKYGGAASHHHAVGRDHLSVHAAEVGPLVRRALSAVKASWDPVGVLNPGALGLRQGLCSRL